MIFWHIIAIATIFILGYFFGRWTIKDYYKDENRIGNVKPSNVKKIDWVA